MLLEILSALVVGTVIYLFLTKKKEETLPMGDGWWGKGKKPNSEEDAAVHPFKIETSESEINDLHRRLDQARFTEPLEDSYFCYGFNTTYLKKITTYWRNQFDWKKQVEVLNRFPQFKTKIEGVKHTSSDENMKAHVYVYNKIVGLKGASEFQLCSAATDHHHRRTSKKPTRIDVHFLHVKPSCLPEGRTAKPLLLAHGWPGSVYEFYKIIPLLTNPASHGLSDEPVFEVICPSIPGYGFSEAPHKKGFTSVSCARIFYKLMLRLGFKEFYAEGGDWGFQICTNLAQIAPNHVKGLHLSDAIQNVWGFKQVLSVLLSVVLGQCFPKLFGYQEEDVQRLFPLWKKMVLPALQESGYFHIQATRPDTVGCGLNDSPLGLAAYILEKFALWTDINHKYLEDGGLEKKFTLDDLLTNVMIYWVSGCIVSSGRFYKENLKNFPGTEEHDKLPVTVPTGITCFPNDILWFPRSWLQSKYINIVSYNYMPRGGHFAAFEEPELLAADIRQFVEKIEKGSLAK